MDKIIPYLAAIAVSMRLAELGANAISILAVSVTIGLCAEYTLKNFSKKERKGKNESIRINETTCRIRGGR